MLKIDWESVVQAAQDAVAGNEPAVIGRPTTLGFASVMLRSRERDHVNMPSVLAGESNLDATRFDNLLRALTAAPSRRGVIQGLVTLVVGSAGSGAIFEADAKRKKKKPCPPCRKRSKGKCKTPLPDGSPCGDVCQECLDGACVPKPDDTVCGDDECRVCASGECVPKPDDTICEDNPCRMCKNGTCANALSTVLCGEGRKCLNGSCPICPSPPALCDPDNPVACASGICGCGGTSCASCACRSADCVGTGESCAGKGNNGCCIGVCVAGTQICAI